MLPAQLLWTKSLWKKHLTLIAATTLLPLPPPPPMQALFRMKPTGKIPTRTTPAATAMQPIHSAIHYRHHPQPLSTMATPTTPHPMNLSLHG